MTPTPVLTDAEASMRSIEILEKLVAFPTVSRESNMKLIGYVGELLKGRGIKFELIPSGGGRQANLFATIGAPGAAGVVLSGHTDVVPVVGQNWSVPAFQLTRRAGRLYGRGTADMKGFVACALAAFLKAADRTLKTPLHLALSYDEEIGCVGVRSMLEKLRDGPIKPLMCIVGEPTNMQVALGHKGKIAARAVCKGREGHSALAPFAVNAIHLDCDFVEALRQKQDALESHGARDEDYEVPYTTLHVGKMNAGVALNIVPNLCEIEFEIRAIGADDATAILDDLRRSAETISASYASRAPEAAIDIDVVNAYPGLDTSPSSQAVSFLKSLTGANSTIKVAFGTEGGLFSRDLISPAVICGPGSMAQGHKPDEFVSEEQLQKCDQMLELLLQRLAAGI
jgi:acetylornithine deacetylase